MEGCRLSTIAPQLNRLVAKNAVIDDGGKQISCKTGDIIFLDLVCVPILAFQFANFMRPGRTFLQKSFQIQRKSRSIVQFPSTSISAGARMLVLGLLLRILD